MMRQSHAPILLTRPLPQSQRFADQLTGLGRQIIISPLMAVEIIPTPRPMGDFAAVIFTSETAVLTRMLDLPKLAYCVGKRTADVAQVAGFTARSAGGDWRDLFNLILADPPKGRLLFLHAEEAAKDLPNMLNSAGLETVSIPVYRQNPQPLTAQAIQILRQETPVILPLFSARSAALFFAEYARIQAKAPIYMAALSPQVAAGISAAELCIAPRPEAQAMLAAVSELAGLC
jgi:uroporphyrinogen-III synthase